MLRYIVRQGKVSVCKRVKLHKGFGFARVEYSKSRSVDTGAPEQNRRGAHWYLHYSGAGEKAPDLSHALDLDVIVAFFVFWFCFFFHARHRMGEYVSSSPPMRFRSR